MASNTWFRLDTAALIFPAIMRRDWCNVFRVSATLRDPIDPEVLQQAADDLRARFPSYYVCLGRGLFWYYLETSHERVTVRRDYAYPLAFMSRSELRRNGLRILYHENRIAVEFFHAITDGQGGSIFLQNLLARYLTLRYGIPEQLSDTILPLGEEPREEELEDSFWKYAAQIPAHGKEPKSYRLRGDKEPDGFKHLITGIADCDKLLDAAHSYGVSVTSFLTAVMVKCVIGLQEEQSIRRRKKPVRITVPLDLRRLYGSRTLRNFTLVLNPGVDPNFGEYSFAELCRVVSHQLAAYAVPQYMAGQMAANVQPQRNRIIAATPLFFKNFVMNIVYLYRGENGGSLNVSNLGLMTLPEAMREYVERFEFIIGTQRSYPNNCSVISYGGKAFINMIRNIRQSELERRFFSTLVELGVPVYIESSDRL